MLHPPLDLQLITLVSVLSPTLHLCMHGGVARIHQASASTCYRNISCDPLLVGRAFALCKWHKVTLISLPDTPTKARPTESEILTPL